MGGYPPGERVVLAVFGPLVVVTVIQDVETREEMVA